MAAPPSKPSSPSNKEVQQTSSLLQEPAVTLKDPPPAAAAASLKDPPPTTTTNTTSNNKDEDETPILSYEHSECSDYYVLAKQLLAEGDFEQALTAIEQGIEESKALLFSVGVQNVDLHESIAPFHYMYGTTLLYSIEESNDTQVTNDVNVDVDGAAQQAQTMEVPDAASAAAPQEEENQEAAPADNADNANADDMHIAWENLEVARTIVEEMLTLDDGTINQTSKSKLQLDLAQILLREGDLQRLNGRYSEAIQDYQACLKLRKLLLPQFDRKIADAQYNLGLSYLSNSSELQKLPQETTTTTTTPPDTTTQTITTLSQEHCHKGMELYVECARTLCGLMALLCGVEPSTVLTTNSEQGGFKTTGLEEEEGTNSSSDASQMLSVWRKNVSTLVTGTGEVVEDLKELLDEIQETVDEAEKSQDAVRQAVQIKLQMQKAIDREDGQDESGNGSGNGSGGVTTTIGFDKPTLTTTDVLAATTTTAQKPMMVVKKKKKRDLPAEDDSKPAAAEDGKRAKTE